MSRTRGPLLLAFSLILGLGAAWLANQWIISQGSADTPSNTRVVTAALDIPLGTRIEARHLATISMLPGSEPRGSYRDLKVLEGKVARADVLAGEIILEPRVADQSAGSALAAV